MQRLCTLWFHLAWQVHCSTNLQSVGRSLHKWIPHPWAKTVTCVTCEVEAAKITSLKLQPAPPQLWIFKTEKIDAEICKPLVSGNNDFEKRKSGLAEKKRFWKTKNLPCDQNNRFENYKPCPAATLDFQDWKKWTLRFANPSPPGIVVLKNANPGMREKTILKNTKTVNS